MLRVRFLKQPFKVDLMGKLTKAMKALWWITRNPVLLNRVLEDEDGWRARVAEKYNLPDGLPVITMDQLMDAEQISLGPMTFLDGGSLPTDMMLLAGMAESIRDCRYFEIGTWRGESVSVVASRAAVCHTLCLTDEQMREMGMHEKTIGSHMLFSKELDNVTQWRGDSRNFDFGKPGHPFDLIFIDGDHHHDVVKSDTEQVFKQLVHEKSVVIWHDYGFHPDKVRFEVMAAILDGAGPTRINNIYHVAHTKCAIFTGREYPASTPGFPVIPGEYYHLDLTRNSIR